MISIIGDAADMSTDAISVEDAPAPSPSGNEPAAVLEQTITYSRFKDLLVSQHQSLISKIDQLRTQFTQELVTIRDKLVLLDSENKSLRSELELIKRTQTTPEPTNSAVSALQDTVTQLQVELNVRDQAMLLNDVELTGIPEFDNESPGHIVLAAAAKLSVKLDERDIVSVARAGPRRKPLPDGRPALPRPLIVRFARRALRDTILKEARVRRGATTAELGLPEHNTRNFHVNERLTKTNRSLFGKARELARYNKWRFVWSSEGRVLARQTDKAPVFQIRSERDLKIFDSDPTVLSTPHNH